MTETMVEHWQCESEQSLETADLLQERLAEAGWRELEDGCAKFGVTTPDGEPMVEVCLHRTISACGRTQREAYERLCKQVGLTTRPGTEGMSGGCPVGLDRDDPEFIRQRQRLWAYADGASDMADEIYELIRQAIGADRRVLAAMRKVRRRIERYRDDALPRAEFIRRVFDGDW